MLKDFIAAEFKSHDHCKKDIIRKDRQKSVVGRKVAEFEKVIDCINDRVFNVNQFVPVNVV